VRTTIDIEDDVLAAARAIAGRRGVSIGRVLSELARQALSEREIATKRNGVPLFPLRRDAGIATLELVNALRDETP
jgi:hypothetical protein